jgi:tetratricopeptide (TPR) repeat protein
MVRSHYVEPAKGPRNALRFSFHDLVILRTARDLLAAGIPSRRIGEALRSLRSQLPEELPARGLSISAAGGRVVVQEAGERRDAVSGQMLLGFEVRPDGKGVALIDAPGTGKAASSDDECDRAFNAALELEEIDVDAAMEAYRACVLRHGHSGARANLGRLLHLQGRISDAVKLYDAGDQADPDLLFNYAVALEDLGRDEEAIAAYARVLDLDRDHADAHHNIARLCQQAGDQRRAVRHWNAYRKLTRGNAN